LLSTDGADGQTLLESDAIETKVSKLKRSDQRSKDTIRASELYDASAKPLLAKTEKFVIVKAVISHYGVESVDPLSFFSTDKYYKKELGKYVGVAPFENYKIFLGTPNL